MEKLDQEIVRRMLRERGFAWLLAELVEIYEDTDKCAVRDVYGQEHGAYVENLMADLRDHFEEVERD